MDNRTQPPLSPRSQPSANEPIVNGQRYKVHHSYIWLGSLSAAIPTLFVIVITILGNKTILDYASNSIMGWSPALSIVLVCIGIIALLIVSCVLSYYFLTYEFTDREFSVYSGVITKKHVHVPYQRVQSVNLNAKVLQRIFGVCTVSIDTAGGSSNKAIVVPYVTNSVAEQLRSELFARKQYVLAHDEKTQTAAARTSSQSSSVASSGSAVSSTSSASDASLQPNVLDNATDDLRTLRGVFGGRASDSGSVTYEYGLSNKELLFTGISNEKSGWVGFLIGLGSLCSFIAPLLDIFSVKIDTLINPRSILLPAIGGIIAFIIIGWIFGIIYTFIQFGGFRARRRDDRIEVERGLLQRQFSGIDIDRVQSVIIKQGFIRRCIGYCQLSLGKIDAATENSGQNKNGQVSQGGLIIHPFVKIDRVPELIHQLIPEYNDIPEPQATMPKVALRRALLRRCIWQNLWLWIAIAVAGTEACLFQFMPAVGSSVLGQNTASLLQTSDLICYIICAIGTLWRGISAVLWARHSGFTYNRSFMTIHNDGLSVHIVCFPHRKIQFGYTRTNPFQAHANVTTINAVTASGVGGTRTKLIDATTADKGRTWLDWVAPSHAN